MTYKIQIKKIIFVVLLIVGYAMVPFDGLEYLRLCEYMYYDAGGYIATCPAYAIQQTFGLFALVTFISLIPLYFLKKVVYLSWRKFAVVYLPIATILIFTIGGTGSSGFNPGVGFDRESLTFFFSGLFAIISLILIIYKSLKLRGK